MCLTVFVGTNHPLPELPLDRKHRAFNTRAMKRSPRALDTSFTVEVGSHTGCACGFINDDKDDASAKESRQQLLDYVTTASLRGEVSVLFAWANDTRPPKTRTATSAEGIFEVDFDTVFDGQPELFYVEVSSPAV